MISTEDYFWYALQSRLTIRIKRSFPSLPSSVAAAKPPSSHEVEDKMSEPIPESIPTSSDRRSQRPLKRARGADTALAAQASSINNLFADPEKEIQIPNTTSNKASRLAPPPEIVANVQGSSAGAGSGEFHVYKASRRREYERLREMDAEAKKEEETAAWEKEEQERRQRDEERTARNREKRAKKKGKQGGKSTAKPGADTLGSQGSNRDSAAGQVSDSVKKAAQVPRREADGDESGPTKNSNGEVLEEFGVVIHDDG